MNSSDKTCWICFENEVPGKIWVSPCKCSGDTKWAHESCLLSWIIRKQSERTRQGEPAPVLIYENGQPDNLERYLDLSADAQPNDGAENNSAIGAITSLFHSRASDLNEYLIKCPQCNTPYRIELGKRGFFVAKFMDAVSIISNVSDFMVPFGVIGGGVAIASFLTLGYGAYIALLFCGPNDLLVRRFMFENSFGKAEMLALLSAPCYFASFSIEKPSSFFFSLASLNLFSSYFLYLQRANVSNLGFLGSSFNMKYIDLALLIKRRMMQMSSLYLLKYLWQAVYDKLQWVIVGTKKQNETDSTSVEDFDLLPADENNTSTYTGFGMMKMFVYSFVFPPMSAFLGFMGKRLGSHLFSPPKFKSMDFFTWSIAGSCTFIFVRDVVTMFYNRQRKYQRRKMHVINYAD